ncbi:glycine N-methyltransferase isoform X1 [Rhinopithecus roxellana]|uniref:glycine N-methyltransferase isoform X1 n=1 Tax=Rhinopithecus roxellana TaxID=61622 RepID=UPI00053346DC|nr:glycine N-methyltransferase isoform X1 [Rhinopithecus roxellana]XP_017733693.1 PREDICTED: glycine N-methyltransferase isoform X1 [Rhinopithecus bieti]
MVDSVYRTRSLGVAAEGLPDQYADGEAARVWQLYIGNTRSRTAEYKAWLLGLLRQHSCQRVLDVACGTGVDSIMLVEEGFSVTSVDASDKMLKYALKERWNRRHEPAFDKWVIEEANWMTLDKDVPQSAEGGFDAVICLGNSFAHLPDCKGERGCGLGHGPHLELYPLPQTSGHLLSCKADSLPLSALALAPLGRGEMGGRLVLGALSRWSLSAPAWCPGDQSEHRLALKNIASMVRAGGLLVIDHRNYDHILSTGCAPPGKNIYYKSDLTKDITTSVLIVNNKAHMVTLDYTVQVPGAGQDGSPGLSKFRLSYYPHCLASFTDLLQAAFRGKCQHSVLGDFKPYKPGQAYVPCYFIHVLKRTD